MKDVRDADEPLKTRVLEEEPVRPRSVALRAIAPLLKVAPWKQSRQIAPEINLKPSGDIDEVETQSGMNGLWLSAVIVVLIPVILSGIYLFFIASDQFASEARFAVKTVSTGGSSSDSKSDTSLSSVLTSGGSLGGQEAEIVANYIKSRAIIDDISKTVDVRALYQRPEADFWSKLSSSASIEDLTTYWMSMVSVYIEATSGIVTVEVRAFRRDDALALANAIVKSSETLVNRLSANVRADAVKHAEEEIKRSEAEVDRALSDLTKFRNTQGLIDPVKSAEQSGKLLLQLMGDKIQTESQLFVALRTTGPDAPGIASVRARLDSVNGQIATLQQQLAGDKGAKDNMAASITRFEELELKRQFSERMYGFARDGMDRARIIAERQSVYIAVFVPPSLPEDYSYPLRFTDFSLLFLAIAIAWASGTTIWASVLDHRL